MSNCLKETPTCVTSHATVVGLFPQNGSVDFQKSISSSFMTLRPTKKTFFKGSYRKKGGGIWIIFLIFSIHVTTKLRKVTTELQKTRLEFIPNLYCTCCIF